MLQLVESFRVYQLSAPRLSTGSADRAKASAGSRCKRFFSVSEGCSVFFPALGLPGVKLLFPTTLPIRRCGDTVAASLLILWQLMGQAERQPARTAPGEKLSCSNNIGAA